MFIYSISVVFCPILPVIRHLHLSHNTDVKHLMPACACIVCAGGTTTDDPQPVTFLSVTVWAEMPGYARATYVMPAVVKQSLLVYAVSLLSYTLKSYLSADHPRVHSDGVKFHPAASCEGCTDPICTTALAFCIPSSRYALPTGRTMCLFSWLRITSPTR